MIWGFYYFKILLTLKSHIKMDMKYPVNWFDENPVGAFHVALSFELRPASTKNLKNSNVLSNTSLHVTCVQKESAYNKAIYLVEILHPRRIEQLVEFLNFKRTNFSYILRGAWFSLSFLYSIFQYTPEKYIFFSVIFRVPCQLTSALLRLYVKLLLAKHLLIHSAHKKFSLY